MKTVAFKQLLLALAAATVGSSAFADPTWQMWDNTPPTACSNPGTSMGNSTVCTGSVVGDPAMTVSAWSTTGAGSTLAAASIQRWNWTVPVGTPVIGQTSAYDYGVVNSTGGQTSIGAATGGVENANGGQHSMDNNGATDLMALSFSKATALTSISLGWTQTDADISVLRYTGSATTLAAAVSGKTLGNGVTGLLTAGWELVGHYADLQLDTSAPIKTANITNAGSSSWWIVSAYNASYGVGTNANGGTTATDAVNTVAHLTAGNDYVKLLQVAGKVETSNKTPEPGSLALMGVAMVGFMATRRRKQQSA